MRLTVPLALLALLLPSAALAAKKPAEPIEPNATAVAVYVPPSMLKASAYLPIANMWIEPGKSLSDALGEVGKAHFPQLHVVPSSGDQRYGLLLDLAPKWTPVAGKVQLTLQYDVYDAAGTKLHSGSTEQASPVRSGNYNGATATASRMALQQVLASLRRKLQPDPVKFPASGSTAKIDLATLVDREKPLRTGTAFFINRSGQLLTAAHVARDCVAMEAHQEGVRLPVRLRASSDLLDVAVLDSGTPRAGALALRGDQQIVLGESVTAVGFPLRGLLGDSANVTRGNVSASKGIRGSMGMFQFSAPIQPGNSGGPIVSDQGELLGMAVSTLNAESLAKRGLIPQNVNFALDARYLAMFLRRENVPFDVIQPKGEGSMQTANQAALSNTLQFTCYQ